MNAPITTAPGTAEREWLADSLAQSVANLGYPVGLGVQPDSGSCLKAADKLLAHFHERDAALQAHADAMAAALAIFLGEDDRFQPMVGGNPIAVDLMLGEARAALAAYQASKP